MNVLETMVLTFDAIIHLSHSKTLFMMKVGVDSRAGESHPLSWHIQWFPMGPETSGRPEKRREHKHG
jgi:hypothetical protein